MSAKRTAWNKFSSSMASAVICLATVDDLSSHNTKYTSPGLTQKVFANMRRTSKGFSGVDTPLFNGMLVQQQVQAVEDAAEDEDDDNEEDASKQGGIAKLDVDEDVTLVDAKEDMNANASAIRKRRGVVIQDPEETATASVIVCTEVKSKDKGKGILIEEPKPLKRQVQIEQDEAFARQLEAKLNANINWDDVMKQVKRREKQDNTVMRYQALKKKPVTEAQARKKMMIYLQVPKASALRKRRGVVIQDPKETATASVIQVKRREKQDNTVMRYQALKKKPVTEAQARKKMMIYLKNMAGFKMDFFKALDLMLLKTSRKYAKGLLLLVEDLMLLVQVKAVRRKCCCYSKDEEITLSN
nr:hypothetical protein [Tanacetum cinerariifolium]